MFGVWTRNTLFLLMIVSTGVSPAWAEQLRARIGHLPIIDHVLIGIAKQMQAEKPSGVEVETVKFSDYASLSESLRSGALTGAFILAPLAFKLRAGGAPIRLVLYGHRDGSALVVSSRSAIQSAADLRGKTIAIPFRLSAMNLLLHQYASSGGLDYAKDLKAVEMPPPEMPAALAQGAIDGFITAEPLVSKAELSGAGRILVRTGQIWKHHPCCVFVLSAKWMAEYPAAARELVQAVMNAGLLMEKDRAGGARLAARFLGFDEKLLLNTLLDPQAERVTFRSLVPLNSELEQMQDYLINHMGLLKSSIRMEDLVDASPALAAQEHLEQAGEQAE